MPITLPVPGGGGATTPQTYYNGNNLGEYQFVSLSEIKDNFIAAYVGEGKILENVLEGDVNFHAHRALQELHYDTLKSCKSQEIEVCSSLKMPLPHDYVNYVKLVSIDSNGIEHILYPARNTSNPFAIEQNADCSYEYNTDGTLVEQADCVAPGETTCRPSDFYIEDWRTALFTEWAVHKMPNNGQNLVTHRVNLTIGGVLYSQINGIEAAENLFGAMDAYCMCLGSLENTVNCGEKCGSGWDTAIAALHTINTAFENGGTCCWPTTGTEFLDDLYCHFGVGECECTSCNCVGWTGSSFLSWGWLLCDDPFGEVGGCWMSGNVTTLPEVTAEGVAECTPNSNSWTNYSSSGSNSTSVDLSLTNNPAVDSSNYYQNTGERYGIDPQYAQGNGSFFIDCIRGNVHFSSNLSGKTITLKYISDGHGTPDEAIVPKLAEEAMYKWIAYGCLSARADSPEYLVARFKKEKFAETRKAKIRLSNIKIEEISQVFRGKSKWIKH